MLYFLHCPFCEHDQSNSKDLFGQIKVYLNLQTAASVLYYIAFSIFFFTLIPPNIRVASRLAISLFGVQNSTSCVAIGLINVLQIFIFAALSADWLFSGRRSAQYAQFAFVILFSMSGVNSSLFVRIVPRYV